jgi:hypothetical protein
MDHRRFLAHPEAHRPFTGGDLFARIGGRAAIDKLVDGLYDGIEAPAGTRMSASIRLPIEEHAALSRISKTLSGAVANGKITAIATTFGFRQLAGSNKIDRIRSLLGALLSDGRSRSTAGTAIETIVVEAIHRTVAGKADTPLMIEDIDAIVAELKVLGLPTGALGRPKCRIGLRSAAPPPVTPPVHSQSAHAPLHSSPPRRHDHALAYIRELVQWDPSRAQQRGREFEKVRVANAWPRARATTSATTSGSGACGSPRSPPSSRARRRSWADRPARTRTTTYRASRTEPGPTSPRATLCRDGHPDHGG